MIDPNKVVDRMWPVVKHAMTGHELAYRATGGLLGHHVPGMPPMLLLDQVGGKSGRKRTTPLAYLQDGDDYVVVASRGGHPKNPAWFHNLRANPDTEIQVGRERIPVRARVATAAQHERLWPKVVDLYSGYQGYQDRTKRKIPLVILKRRST